MFKSRAPVGFFYITLQAAQNDIEVKNLHNPVLTFFSIMYQLNCLGVAFIERRLSLLILFIIFGTLFEPLKLNLVTFMKRKKLQMNIEKCKILFST
jgi:hypothetical protein